MEIRVLGPLEIVSSSGTPVEVRSATQRELLALLVAHAPLVVSADRIMEALWPDGRDHRGSLRFHVSKLRDTIDPDRRRHVIVTRPPGYGLDLDEVDVDAVGFVDLIERAGAIADSDVAAARDLLHEALGLCRGPAFAEFQYAEWAQGEIARLEEERLAARELLNDLDLAMGRHREVLPVLDALVVEHPWRERFWRQLIVGLHRSGRPAEARDACRRARAAFREIGVDVSRELAELDALVARQDPSLDLVTPVTVPEGNLPLPLSTLIGREREIEEVGDLVARHRLVTLVGAGGVGKTRLAIEVARDLAARFSRGVWLVELAGVEAERLVPARVADTLGVVEPPDRDVVSALTELLADRDLLVVLDNCEHVVGAVAPLVSDLLAHCGGLHVLVTSRMPLRLDSEVTWRTTPLAIVPPEDESDTVRDGPPRSPAVRLFIDRAAAAQPTLVLTGDDERRVDDVCRHLEGLPLAIELAAARLRSMSLSRLLGRIDDQRQLLADGPTLEVQHHGAMHATLDWSYRLLPPPEQTLFRRLAVFRGGFTLDAAERFHSRYSTDARTALTLLSHLVDASVVEYTSDDRYRILEPIRQYAIGLLEDAGELGAARTCHSSVYREMFRLPDSDLYGPAPGSVVETMSAPEINNLVAALEWAAESGDTATLAELGSTFGCLLGGLGFLGEAEYWYERVLAATTEPTPHRCRALARGMFVVAARSGIDRAHSHLEELARAAEALDSDPWRAVVLERTALMALMEDDVATASELWDEASERLLALDTPSAWVPLCNHMEALFYAGDVERAERATAQLAELGERHGMTEMVRYAVLGRSFVEVDRGDPDEAQRHLDQVERRPAAASTTGGVGRFEPFGSMLLPAYIALLRDDVEAAEQLVSRELGAAIRSRHPDAHVRGVVLMGLVHFRRGESDHSLRVLGDVLAQADRAGLSYFQRYVLGAIAAPWALIDPDRGATLIAAVDAFNRRDGRSLSAPIAEAQRLASVHLTSVLTPAALDRARRRGAAMTLGEAVAVALGAPTPVPRRTRR